MIKLPKVDEVGTFKSLTMPHPIKKEVTAKGSNKMANKNLTRTRIDKPEKSTLSLSRIQSATVNDNISLTESLRTAKIGASISYAPITDNRPFVGFNASNLVFDGKDLNSFKFPLSRNKPIGNQSQPSLSLINLDSQGQVNPVSRPKHQSMLSNSLAELRNYSLLMDQYSLHNFLIWNGEALHNTPEFQSFRRTYDHEWGPISTLITGLEQIMNKYNVKLAIVNGQKTAELAQCGLPYYEEEDLLACITNIEQIKPQLTSFIREGKNEYGRAIIKIQSIVRQWISRRKYNIMKSQIISAIKIQSIIRMFLCRCRALSLLDQASINTVNQNELNIESLKEIWSESTTNQQKLFIHIPSTQFPEYIRLGIDNLAAMENSHLSCLYQLHDPNIHIAYICPSEIGAPEQMFHEKFLQVMGISTVPKRLRFVVPNILKKLPPQIPLSHVLWYCSTTLRKLKAMVKQFPCAVIVCSSIGWAEKRISNFLKVPILAPEVSVAETLSTPTFSKQFFTDCLMNIPMGVHAVSSEDDLILSFARLIASNLDVERWVIRLNSDLSNETVAYIDTKHLPVVNTLRAEQATLLQRHHGDMGSWYSKHVQASARKRLVASLEAEIPHIVKICRLDIFMSWSNYLEYIKKYGAIIDSEPREILGYVEGLCFIDPFGNVSGVHGVESILDENYQQLEYIFPQKAIPSRALQGATVYAANELYSRWSVVGYVQISFLSYWDCYDESPRLLALGLKFGMTPAFGSLGTLATIMHDLDIQKKYNSDIPRGVNAIFLPQVTEGRSFVHIPVAVHLTLRKSRDDVFFQQCRMNGISFDSKHRVGTLFFLVDAIVGGVLSIICIGSTRIKAIEIAVDALTFISNNFGRYKYEDSSGPPFNDLTHCLLILRSALKRENKIKK